MQRILIKTEKQENGIWGMPLSIETCSSVILKNQEKQLIQSAVLISLCELNTNPRSIYTYNDINFDVIFHSGNRVKYFYDDYMVVDNYLYIFSNENEKIKFTRKKKIENILSN